MNKQIELLNRRLGVGLGCANGTTPRFAWIWAPESFYFYRQHVGAGWVRQCWADRIGKVWMLGQWRPPAVPENAWWGMFHGEFPYPRKGMYYAHPETAIPHGQEPTAEMTDWYIRTLDAQISKDYAEHLEETNAGIERDKQAADSQWVDMVQNENPAFSKDRLTPALHGANVEFQAGL